MRFLWTQFVLPFKVGPRDILYHPFQYLSLFSRTPQIITIMDFIPLYYPEVAKHQYYYYKYIMPFLLKKAHKIICISENTKDDILKFYKVKESKIKVVYCGYDENTFDSSKRSEAVLRKYNIDYDYMLMVGASYPHKNLESAIEAYSKIQKETNCRLIIVGKDSPYVLKLKKLAEELGVKDKVNFLGYVPDADLPSLYSFSKAFVYPTLYEGFGLPILEAVACGTAVLCSNNSSLPEAAGKGAVYFDPRNIKEISEAMVKLLKDEAHRRDIIKKGQENLKRFSWKNTAEQIYQFSMK